MNAPDPCRRPHCPKCDSEAVQPVASPSPDHSWKCGDCGASFGVPAYLLPQTLTHDSHYVEDGRAAPLVSAEKHGFRLETGKMAPHWTVPMILFCPNGHRHIDEQAFAEVPHHTHACQECGIVWRPALVNTHGVEFLPGFKYDV